MIKVCNLKKILLIILVIVISTVILFSKKYFNNKTIEISSTISNNSYKILVDVEDSKLFLFENDKLIKTYKCSGGKWSTPSPIGTWTIISKAKWGEGFRTEALWELMFHGGNLEYMGL